MRIRSCCSRPWTPRSFGCSATVLIEFSHPLFAAAVYAAAPIDARRRAHPRAARTASDVEEQARHLSLASDGPDPALADLLDRAAEHAFSRGAPEIAAELAEQAARGAAQRRPAICTGSACCVPGDTP